ncbi:MAG: Rpn family recombination-promoting nuclease/putative transposase, partial [Synergistes sp.]|nr:Rpn family recombination-promoting nuclease/putative transposase [Synergistes sp.]
MDYVEKEWKKATITDNFMFRLVMENEDLCKTLIERILNIKIGELQYVEHEKSFELKLDGKGARLDLYVTDEDGTAYDVEMQTNNSSTEHLGKRTRYYQSMMDGDALRKGAFYRDLRKSIIIFICTFDPFGENLGKYTFNNI